MGGELVLVTGGSGFVAAHCMVQLLNAGYRVRTTVRSLQREGDVRAMLTVGGIAPGAVLSFVAADLTADAHWADAVAGCDYVLHVASPFVLSTPQHEDELIIPARDGALRVLRTARDAGVKRVVLTSSFVAIGYGHPPTDRPFTEEHWTDLTAGVNAYAKSKTLAERAAWEFMAREGGALELAVVNPAGVFGPVLGPDLSESIQLVQQFMNGSVPGIPQLAFPMVDVRDVADLHLRAMTHPAASGERFLAAADGVIATQDIAHMLRKRMGNAAARVPTRVLPNWLLRLAARFTASVRPIVPELGHIRYTSNEKAKQVLGWTPRSLEESIVATAESLVRLGLLRTPPQAA